MEDCNYELFSQIEKQLGLVPGKDTGTEELLALLQKCIFSYLPTMTIVEISEFENKNRQSYQFLYQSLLDETGQLSSELADTKNQLDAESFKVTQLQAELDKQKSVNERFLNTTQDIVDYISTQTKGDIIVNHVIPADKAGNEIVTKSDSKRQMTEDSLSLSPAVYENRRPGWFTPLSVELNQLNVAKKTADHTKGFFLEHLLFWKRFSADKEMKKMPVEQKIRVAEEERRAKIAELLNSSLANEEKFIKYMLLSPGISKDYMKTLTGAEQLGLDANVVIPYLEQPGADFNKEIFEAYVSQVRKGTEYNLKRELAEELVRGEWYVAAEVNGISQKFQLVPFEQLSEMEKKLEDIASILKAMRTPAGGDDSDSESLEQKPVDAAPALDAGTVEDDVAGHQQPVEDVPDEPDEGYEMEYDDSVLDDLYGE